MGIILLGGLFTAWALGFFAERLFRVIGFDHLCDRLGMNAALLRGGVKTDPSRIVGRSIYWTVLVLASIAALGALNLTPINQFAQSLLAYVPHLMTAVVILSGGYFLRTLSRAVLLPPSADCLPPDSSQLVATAGDSSPRRAMALEQLGIAQHIVVVGFGIYLGGGSSCWPGRLHSDSARSRRLRRVLGTTVGGPIKSTRSMISITCNGAKPCPV